MDTKERRKLLAESPPRTAAEHALAASDLLADYYEDMVAHPGRGFVSTPFQVEEARSHALVAIALVQSGLGPVGGLVHAR